MTVISLSRNAARFVDPRTWNAVRIVASLVWLGTAAGIVACLVLWSGLGFATPPLRFASPPVIAGEGLLSLAYASVGWVLATRKPRNPIGWMFLAIGLATAAQMPVTQLVTQAHQVLRPIDTSTLYAAWLASSAHLPFVAALAITVFVIFPDGRPLSRAWLAPALIAIAGSAIVAAASALSPQGLIWYPSLANPFALPEWLHPAHTIATAIGAVFIIGGLSLAASSIVVRYRRADAIGRAQLRWIVYAIVLIALTAAPFLAVMYAMGAPGPVGDALLLAMVITGSFLPIAAAVAITKYRLFEIDLIINRTLVYVPLLALLGGMFAAGITFSQRVFIAATGNTSDLAIVMTTLFVAAVETPVRRGLEGLVDRHVRPATRESVTKSIGPPPDATSPHDRLGVTPYLEAAGYTPLPERPPEPPGAEGRDMIALVDRLTRRLEELESRVQAEQEGMPAPGPSPRRPVPLQTRRLRSERPRSERSR